MRQYNQIIDEIKSKKLSISDISPIDKVTLINAAIGHFALENDIREAMDSIGEWLDNMIYGIFHEEYLKENQ